MSRRRSIRLVLLLLVGLISGSPLAVQADETARAAAIPAKIVAGKLVVSCDVSTRFRRIPVTLFIELETRAGFQLHNRAAAGIRAENPDGTANPITIHLPDLDIKVPRRELGPEKLYEDFTKYYSPEMGDQPFII